MVRLIDGGLLGGGRWFPGNSLTERGNACCPHRHTKQEVWDDSHCSVLSIGGGGVLQQGRDELMIGLEWDGQAVPRVDHGDS